MVNIPDRPQLTADGSYLPSWLPGFFKVDLAPSIPDKVGLYIVIAAVVLLGLGSIALAYTQQLGPLSTNLTPTSIQNTSRNPYPPSTASTSPTPQSSEITIDEKVMGNRSVLRLVR